MSQIRVPARYLQPLNMIKSLSESEMQQVRSALSQDSVLEDAESMNTVHDKEKIVNVTKAVLSLYFLMADKSYTPSETANVITQALSRQLGERAQADTAVPLTKLLSNSELADKLKVKSLIYGDERTYSSSRIVSDLRPIFGSNVHEKPIGLAVVHHLRLGYHNSRDDRDSFHMTLTQNELNELKSIIERAVVKGETLMSLTQHIGIKDFTGEINE